MNKVKNNSKKNKALPTQSLFGLLKRYWKIIALLVVLTILAGGLVGWLVGWLVG